MTVDKARSWLIIASLVITGLQILFLVVAPAVGYPLPYPKNLALLQIVAPVFLGYLGAAAHFIFNPVQVVRAQLKFLGLLVRGPIIIYALTVIAILAVFGYSNRFGAPIGSGVSVDNVGTVLSIALGVLAATTSVVSSYLFGTSNSDQSKAASQVNPNLNS